MTVRRFALGFVLAVLIVPASVFTASVAAEETSEAEPVAQVEEKIVVSANRLETPVENIGSSVTVITAEEIDLKKKSSVAELLRTVAGVEVVRSGGYGQITSVFVRGGSSSQALVLIDGVRVNTPTNGAFDLANLAADAIERIEIVRGPQSTLYGSEAMAGVISIFSKNGGEGLELSGLVEAGDLGARRLRASVAGGDDRFAYAVTVSDEEIDGVSTASERRGNTEDDPYEATSATAHLGFGFGDDGQIDVDLRYFDAEVGNDGFDFLVGPVDDLNRIQSREGVTGSVRLRTALSDRWQQSLTVGFHDEDLEGRDPDDTFSNFGVENSSFEIASQSDLTLADSGVLTLGVSYEEREGGSVGSFDESVDLLAGFAQLAWSWDERFFLTLGARHDDHSLFGGETTYRLSTSWNVADGTRLHGTFGTGFKAPTLNDLFFPFFSNPSLVPETSQAFDIGIEQTWGDGRWLFDATYFDIDFEDLIAFSFVTFVPENTAEATSSGIELTLEYRPSKTFQMVASHTYNETEDLATGAQLARRPENRSTLDLFFRPVPRLSGSASLMVVSDRIDSDGSDLDDYERVDLSLTYDVSEGFAPYLRVENLFDEEYEEINGFTTPGILTVVGLSFKR